MTDEIESLRGTRAAVDPPSADARRVALEAWSGVESAARATVGAHRESKGRVFAARTLVATMLVSALVAGGWIVTRNRVDSVKPLHIVTVTSLASVTATDPQVFLLVGSDSRAFVTSETDKQRFGDPAKVSGARSDSMIVVRVDPKSGQVLVVSIPRDLFVDVPGCGKERISAAFNTHLSCADGQGGTGLLVETITRDLGIPINHVIELGFPQFATLTSRLGGLRISFPEPARDSDTGLNAAAGCTTLSGDQALAFVRARHLEWFNGTEWLGDASADLGRMARQQLAIRQLATAAEAQMGTDPRPLLNTLFANVTVDSGFTADDALRYFAALRNNQNAITATLATDPQVYGDQDGLVLDPSAQPVLDALAGHGTIGAHDVPAGPAGSQATAC
jgi:LCP family protein required for cell wall assembly